MDWEIKIRKAENGYICSWEEESEDDEPRILKKEQVFEEKEDSEEFSELDCMKEVLYFIAEYFGINYNKHNSSNLKIEVEKRKKE
jgi:hypothetical protein